MVVIPSGEPDRDMEEKSMLESKILSAVLETVGSLVIILDADRHIIHFNTACERVTGYTADEARGRKPWDFLVAADEIDEVKCVFGDLSGKEKAQGKVAEWIAKDGSTIRVSWDVTVLADEAGNIENIIACGTDLTHVEKTEEALRLSEERYRKLFDGAHDLIFVYGRNENGEPGKFIDVNRRACTRLGYSREELLGMTIRDIASPDDRLDTTRIIDELMANGHVTYERILRTRFGENLSAEISSHIFNLNGESVTLSIARDITERKMSEKVLRSERNFVSTILDTVNAVIVVLDQTGKIVRCNRELQEVTGHGLEDISGKAASDFFTFIESENGEGVEPRGVADFAREGEVVVQGRDGNERILSYSGVPLISDGVIKYIIGTAIDITDRKAADAEINRKNKELIAALTAKSDFLSMVSHELRSPLVPILGYTELLSDGSLGEVPDSFREPLKILHSRAESLSHLIEDLLQITKFERGMLRLDFKPIRIKSLLDDMLIEYRDFDFGKPVKIVHEGEDFCIRADGSRLRQVLQNLIGNSIKYSGDTVEIRIRSAANNDCGHIEVIDNGIGIPTDKIGNIFDMFFQVENLDTRHHEGAGLGLSIARELVELMDGSITVASTEGEGTTFTLSFPLSTAEKR
jgi:PAS domain S-box-containing protein